MNGRTLATLTAAALLAHPAAAHAQRHAHSTAYCLTGTMADGTQTRHRSVAMNRHPLGTRLYITDGNLARPGQQKGANGLRRFVVRDRIGWGSELDFWTPGCGIARQWGRRSVAYRLGWAR